MSDDRCHVCDRPSPTEPMQEGACHLARITSALAGPTSSHHGWIETQHTLAEARRDCAAHAVDWRARAKAAESALLIAAEPIEALNICNQLEPGAMHPVVVVAIAKAADAIRACLPRMTTGAPPKTFREVLAEEGRKP